MENILLISNEPERWDLFEKGLRGSYRFIVSNPTEKIIFSNTNLIAVDKVEYIEKIPATERRKLPIIFFGNSGDFSTEINARKFGVADFFSLPFNRDLFLLRLKNVKTNYENIHWMQMIRREMIYVQDCMAEILAQTVESRDENTGGHILRTATFIGILGEEFVECGMLTREQVDLIIRAALLHDVGKIGVKDSILLKPGPLTDEERLEMMGHTEKGAVLIKKMQKRFESHAYLQYAYDIALNHHEHFNGKGYPNGKKGEEIPFWARLMSVVDVYDALVSDRVYRNGMPKDKAFEIIFNGSGTQFDPVILKAFDNCKDLMI